MIVRSLCAALLHDIGKPDTTRIRREESHPMTMILWGLDLVLLSLNFTLVI